MSFSAGTGGGAPVKGNFRCFITPCNDFRGDASRGDRAQNAHRRDSGVPITTLRDRKSRLSVNFSWEWAFRAAEFNNSPPKTGRGYLPLAPTAIDLGYTSELNESP